MSRYDLVKYHADCGERMSTKEIIERAVKALETSEDAFADVLDDLFLLGCWGGFFGPDDPDDHRNNLGYPVAMMIYGDRCVLARNIRGLVLKAYRQGRADADAEVKRLRRLITEHGHFSPDEEIEE